MISQTLALFIDAFRELRARKLFWISMILSGLVAAVFGCIGVKPDGMTFLWWNLPMGDTGIPLRADVIYKSIYVELGLKMWLGWIAMILALVSTGGLIPDLIASGAIDSLLSKPISRARLFFTKYICGMFFVGLQVFVFSFACFLVIGFRGGSWELGLFLAVPIMVLFFSYLFCVCCLLGLITRSTIASILLTVLFWGAIFVFNSADAILVSFKSGIEQDIEFKEAALSRRERVATLATIKNKREAGEEVPEDYRPTEEELFVLDKSIPERRSELVKRRSGLKTTAMWQGIIERAKTPLPKTVETVELMNRWMISTADLDQLTGPVEEMDEDGDLEDVMSSSGTQLKIQQEFRSRSVTWIIGTSLGFEAIILGISIVIFTRRDF